MGMNGAIANSDSSIVYVFNSYGPSGLQYPQFFGLSNWIQQMGQLLQIFIDYIREFI